MLHWLLARLFPRFVPKALATTQETAPLSQELTVAYAARSADVQSLRELDLLFAVCSVALPQAIALQMSPTLNDALRSVTPPNMWDALATQDTPYVLSANHPHFPLRYLLETSPVWSCLDLYRLGVRLKHLERSEVDSCALPSDAYGNAFGLGS